jgi:hypothetical protein
MLAACPWLSAQNSETLDLSAQQWREDLQFLARELPKRHANAFHSTSKAQFEAAVADLDSRLDRLNADQIWTAMLRITSLIGDAHTYLRFPADSADLPLVISKFGDEYRVARVAPGLERALGARVLKIADTPVAAAREILAPLAPIDIYPIRAEALAAIDFHGGKRASRDGNNQRQEFRSLHPCFRRR